MKSLNRNLTCEWSEFGKRGIGPLDEVIHQISIGCDMQFQRKVRRKYLFRTELLAKSDNKKLTSKRSEFGKRGMGPLDEVIHQISIGCDMQFHRKVRRKIFISH